MKIEPFFSYYGSKHSFAWRYPAPHYDTIVEAFAGSAAYSLHYCDRKVILYDVDPVIAGLWNYLIHVKRSEILSLPGCEDLRDLPDRKIPQEAKWLIGFWLSKAA